MKNTLGKILAAAVALSSAFSALAVDESTSVETKAAIASTKKVDESKLSPATLKVARLLQSGMDEKVIVAYVKNNPPTQPPSAEELVHLHELGVTTPVLTALLTETKKAPVVGPAKVSVAAPAERVEVTSNYTPIPGAPQPQSQAQVNGSTVVSVPVAAPAPVIVQQPAPQVVYQPAPVIVHTPPPVYYDPAPRITFGFGFRHFGHFGHHHRHSIFRHHHGHFGHHRGRHH